MRGTLSGGMLMSVGVESWTETEVKFGILLQLFCVE